MAVPVSRAALLLAFATLRGAAERFPGGCEWIKQFHEKLWVMSRPELPMIQEIDGCTGDWAEMYVKPLEIEDPFTGEKVLTRSFNGMLPGPTFRIKPGCEFKLRIHNLLQEPSPLCPETWTDSEPVVGNWTCYLNHTNIHTHGLHVSSNAPSDSIFMRTEPNSTKDWIFPLPANHMGGTHWYHPHLHHSTSAQAGGGMAGALIVEDPHGAVPPYVEKMEEKLLVFLAIDWALQAATEKLGQGTVFWQTESDTIAMLVNGAFQPKVTITSGKWYRFRMVFSAVELLLQMTNKGSAICNTKLLAKDGIWLNVAPRDLRTNWTSGFKPVPIQLGPGNRADIAMACVCPLPWLGCFSEFYSLQNCSAQAKEVNLSSQQMVDWNNGQNNPPDGYIPCDPTSNRRRRGCEGVTPSIHPEVYGPLEPPKCGFGHPYNDNMLSNGPGTGNAAEDTYYGKKHGLKHSMMDIFNGTIFSVVVRPTRSPFIRWWVPAWKFVVRRPCYLVSLMNAVIPAQNMRNVQFFGPIYQPAGPGNVQNMYNAPRGPISFMYNGTSPLVLPWEGQPNVNDRVPTDARKFVDPPIPEPYGDNIPAGSSVQWNVGGVAFHPFHLHVTPYQVFNFSSQWVDEWLQPGDWQDVVVNTAMNCITKPPCVRQFTGELGSDDFNLQRGAAGLLYVRFWTADFTGRYISHCHLLTHEDEGMMFYFNVSGEEGQLDPQQRQIDPTCYQGHLKDATPKFGWKWAIFSKDKGLVQSGRRLRSTRRHRAADEEDGDEEESMYLQEEMETFSIGAEEEL